MNDQIVQPIDKETLDLCRKVVETKDEPVDIEEWAKTLVNDVKDAND